MFGIGKPKVIKDPIARGRWQYENGMRAEAIESFTEAIATSPVEAYMYRASVYHSRREYEKAIADYDRAIELQPNNSQLYYFRGNAYHMFDRPLEALADMNRALQLNPGNARAWENRRFLMLRLKMDDPGS